MNRTSALNALRNTKVFRNTSVSLLADLVEVAGFLPQHYLHFTDDLLKLARDASFSLFTSLDLRDCSPAVRGSGPLLHTIWVCESQGLKAPLEALTQLLAASIARDFREPTATAVCRDGVVELALWDERTTRFVSVSLAASSSFIREDDILKALLNHQHAPFFHVFFLNPSDPDTTPPRLACQRFHRIVYLTDAVPKSVPAHLEKRLKDMARNQATPGGEPYFSSFISALVRSSGKPVVPGAFVTVAIDDDFQVRSADAPAQSRLRRDSCRLAVPLDDVERRWYQWQANQPKQSLAFPLAVFGDRPRYKETVSRWGRAVTNRRVGFGVSGGGASCYRIVPLISMLHAKHVPIDVYSGVSGGAVIGAYYCRYGLAGLKQCIRSGPVLQLVVLLSALRSRCIELQGDYDLGRIGIDELEVRFVPLTAALREGVPPEAHAIVGGTLGEAVRASGGAPVVFEPTQKGAVRYTDGGIARPIPARVLRDFGADIVFACNAVPGPLRRNPLSEWPLGVGELLYHHTFVGRIVDAWVSIAFAAQQISREVAEDADVFFEPLPQENPFLETPFFYRARAVADRAKSSVRLQQMADDCRDRWRQFSGSSQSLRWQ